MLTAHHLHKTFGIQPILEDISFSISGAGTRHERVGLIGPNGSGKTTLMRILAGLEQPDSGTVASTRPKLRIGYLAQGMDFENDETLQTALSLNPISQADVESEIASLASALSSNPNDSHLQAQYDSALKRLSTFDVRPESILGPLGLADIPPDTPINHLDIPSRARFEEALANFKGTILAVVHDRYFIERFASDVWNVKDGTVKKW